MLIGPIFGRSIGNARKCAFSFVIEVLERKEGPIRLVVFAPTANVCSFALVSLSIPFARSCHNLVSTYMLLFPVHDS